jgi:hypothetical protein
MTGTKKEKQISFRTDPEFAGQLEAWAREEEISTADLIRKLIKVSAKIYREAGSLHELKKYYSDEGERVPQPRRTKRA